MFKRIFFISLLILFSVLISLNDAGAQFEGLPTVISDSINDGLPDIVSVQAMSDSTRLNVRMNFDTVTIMGDMIMTFVLLDTDQDTTTGNPAWEYFGSFEQDIGVDYYFGFATIDTSNVQIEVCDEYTNLIGIVPGIISGSSLEISVPLIMLGGDDGNMNIATGASLLNALPYESTRDYAPDSGHGIVSLSLITYPPYISSVIPDSGYNDTITNISINGDNFDLSCKVYLETDTAYLKNTVDTPGEAYSVNVYGDYAYVADRGKGLQIIDISSDSAAIVGNVITNGDAYYVCVQDDYLYIGTNIGLQIMGINDPVNPNPISDLDISGGAFRIEISGDHAYIAAEYAGLQIVNVSDPYNPFIEGSFNDTTSYVMDVSVSGNYAYLSDTNSGLQVIDVTDPANPTMIAMDTSLCWGVEVSGDYAFLASIYEASFRIINISNPYDPILENTIPTPEPVVSICVSGNYLYAAEARFGLQIYNIQDQVNPVLISTINDTPYYGFAIESFVLGNRVYVADELEGIQIIEKGASCEPAVYLDKYTMTASVPQSITPGMYDVIVYNSQGQEGVLSNGFTVLEVINNPPVLDPIGNKTVNEAQLLQFTVTGSDPDEDEISFSVNGLPAGAGFDTTTNTFVWTPTYSQSGTYPVTFTVTDGSLTDSEEITITVNNVNREPVLDPIGNKTVDETQLLQFAVSGSDPDGDAISFYASGLPAGAVFDTTTNTFTWTPDDDQAGTYNVLFTVSDGILTDSETITITVNDIMPDLTVIDMYRGNKRKLFVKISNIGNSVVSQGVGHLRIWVNGKVKWTVNLGSLADQSFRNPGGVTVVQFGKLKRTKTIKAHVDYLNVIEESDENNNIMVKSINF